MSERSEVMTVARVFEPTEDGAEVVFLESAMFYKVRRGNPEFESIMSVLLEAVENGTKVEVIRESITGNIITYVRVVS